MNNKIKLKILKRYVNYQSCANDTWLAPYVGYIVLLYQFSNGVTNMLLDGVCYENVEVMQTSEYNGWDYNIFNLTDKKPI